MRTRILENLGTQVSSSYKTTTCAKESLSFDQKKVLRNSPISPHDHLQQQLQRIASSLQTANIFVARLYSGSKSSSTFRKQFFSVPRTGCWTWTTHHMLPISIPTTPPTSSEILEIKDFLTKPLARLTSIKAEIDRLNSIIEKLYDEHSALNAEIEAHRALLSPLRQVPLDIMEEIFTHCLPTDQNAVMSTREAPLLLGRVCSEWRSITLSTPRLWASLHIPSSTPESFIGHSALDFEIEKCCKGAEEWIRRSGECPLSISLHTPSPHCHSDIAIKQPFEEVSKQILLSSKRWKNFSCRGLNDSFTHFQKIAEGDVPMLESLGIAIVPGTFSQSFVTKTVMDISGLLLAPKLRKLSLTCFRENLLSLPVRWSQLTHLILDAEDSNESLRMPCLFTYSQVSKVLKNCLLLVVVST